MPQILDLDNPTTTQLLTNWCPADGPLDAPIVLVGEAPGSQERRLKRPFKGPAGQLLDKLLLRAGLSRDEFFITNVIKEQPLNNDITPFLDLAKKIPVKGPKWQFYLDLLQEELSQTTAHIIIACGAVSLWALCGLKQITKRRGSVLPSTLLPGRKVIPIIHPSAALREYLFTYPIIRDLKQAKAESGFPEIRGSNFALTIAPDFNDVLSFISSLHTFLHRDDTKPVDYTELDIEVFNEEISCLSIGHASIGTMSIPFISEQGDYFSPEQEVEIWSALATLFEAQYAYKLGQNITFDSTFIFRKFGIRTFPVLDTMVAQGIAYPDLPKGLDYLTSMYSNEPYYKDEGKKWFKLGGSFRDLWLYNAKDSAVLPGIHTRLQTELARQSNLHAYKKQLELIEPLVYIQERGILCNAEGLHNASVSTGERLAELTSQLHSICGFELNPASPKQLVEYFYGTKKFRPYTDRKTGNVTVRRDALKRIARKGSPEATILLEIRKLGKLKGTYLDIKLDPDSRLRCAFNPVGTTSGRLSSSQTIFGTGGNLQNLPSEFKQFLLFDPGYVGYQIDLSQAENRTVAYVAPDELMIRAFEEGMDIHSLTGSLIFGVPYDVVKDEDERGVCCEIGGGIYTRRFWGKKANHGLNYDLGYRTFAFYYEIPEREAAFIVERYHRAYPGVRQYHSWVRSKLSQGRRITNCLGRTRLFLDRWGDALFKEAYSFIPQSSIADKVNHHGLIPVYYEPEFSEVDILNQVHDSLVFQIPLSIPLERHVEILLDLRTRLESPLTFEGLSFVIPADIEAAPSGGNLGKFKPDKNPLGLRKVKGYTPSELLSSLRSIIELT